jgi:hypothetical protein
LHGFGSQLGQFQPHTVGIHNGGDSCLGETSEWITHLHTLLSKRSDCAFNIVDAEPNVSDSQRRIRVHELQFEFGIPAADMAGSQIAVLVPGDLNHRETELPGIEVHGLVKTPCADAEVIQPHVRLALQGTGLLQRQYRHHSRRKNRNIALPIPGETPPLSATVRFVSAAADPFVECQAIILPNQFPNSDNPAFSHSRSNNNQWDPS